MKRSEALERLARLLEQGAAVADRHVHVGRSGYRVNADELRAAASAARSRAAAAKRIEDAIVDLVELGHRFDVAMTRARGQMRKFAHLLPAGPAQREVA